MRKTMPFVDVAAWVDSGSADPVRYQDRQAAHILLNAIAAIHPSHTLYLKGGLLLGLVYDSPRMTTDIDLTAGFRPQKGVDEEIKEALNQVLPQTIARLGYIGAKAFVNRVEIRPRKFADNINEARFPALRIIIHYVSSSKGKPRSRSVRIDISFNEPDLRHVDILDIGSGGELHTYSLTEVIAEKYRALIQQVKRKHVHYRRQDVYDLDFLQKTFEFDADDRMNILETFIEKCHARDIEPDIYSLDDPRTTLYPQVHLDKLTFSMYLSLHAGSEPNSGHASRCGFGASRRPCEARA